MKIDYPNSSLPCEGMGEGRLVPGHLPNFPFEGITLTKFQCRIDKVDPGYSMGLPCGVFLILCRRKVTAKRVEILKILFGVLQISGPTRMTICHFFKTNPILPFRHKDIASYGRGVTTQMGLSLNRALGAAPTTLSALTNSATFLQRSDIRSSQQISRMSLIKRTSGRCG